MSINLVEAAAFIDGVIYGNKNIIINNLAKIDEAQPGDLTFLYLSAYEKFFPDTKASAILVKPGFNKNREDITYIEVNEPNTAFSKLIIKYFSPEFTLSGVDPSASVHPTAVIGNNTAIGKNVVISAGCKIGDNVKIYHNTVLLEEAEVGDDSLIFSNVNIREKCKIGKRAVIHPGVVIGSDGFGFYTDEKGVYHKIPQIGNVIIEDDVELGSNVTIDRAAIGTTLIKRGVKIDNLVQIAHNVVVGEDTVISSQSGVSGSTKIGDHCILAGQVGLVGHINIADYVILTAQSGISKSITKPGQYFGSPAKEFKTALKLEAHIRNLPDYVDRIKKLEAEVNSLHDKLKNFSNGK
jgi:UDP-3-O-[3-hydroxymyristoyl] glucosamine N-acyltransferase